MAGGGLGQDGALEHVQWLVRCGMVASVEISCGNAENKTSKVHTSFNRWTISRTLNMRELTRLKAGSFADFCEKVHTLKTDISVQLSGNFRSRTDMANAIDSGDCQLIALGRPAVLKPELLKKVLNPEYDDSGALAISHIVKGRSFSNMIPIKIVGRGLPVQFFYCNMRRLGPGLSSDNNACLPWVSSMDTWESIRNGDWETMRKLVASQSGGPRMKTES